MENEREIVEEKETEKKDNVQELFSDYVMKLPDSEKEADKIKEPNRPAFWTQRIAAGLVDLCILFLSCWGLFELFIMTGMGDSLREQTHAMQEVVDYYKIVPCVEGSDETYGYKLYYDQEGYDKEEYKDCIIYHDVDVDKDYKIVDNPEHSEALVNAYKEAVTTNQKYKNASFNYRLINYGVICLAGVISETVFLLVIPLTNKSRATLGKLAAGLMVINKKYQVEAKWYQMVGRLIWIIIFESALPLLIFPSVGSFNSTMFTATLVPLLLFLITLTNKDKCTLHDFVARTRVIEKRTYVPLNEQ